MDTVIRGDSAGQHGGVGRKSYGDRRDGIGKEDAFRRQFVNIWGGGPVKAITAKVIGAASINADEHYVSCLHRRGTRVREEPPAYCGSSEYRHKHQQAAFPRGAAIHGLP